MKMGVINCDSVGALLGLYWVLCSSAAFVALQEWSWTEGFKALVMLSAARGKTWATRDRRWRSVSDWSVPQFYFWHFYALAVAVTLIAWYVSEHFDQSVDSAERLLHALFFVHVFRRLIETCWLLRYPPNARMHLFAYLYGLSYYVVVPFSICFPSVCSHSRFSLVWNIFPITEVEYGSVSASSHYVQQAGIIAYATGSAIQLQSHFFLSKLQTNNKDNVYIIPKGGLFEYVSCPHYLGEILIYCGLSLIGLLRLLLVLINCWVVLNLMLGAREMHNWYLNRFPHYPQKRFALIPFLY